MILFLKVFFTEFIAEMGDKTQLMLIALTSKYKLKDIIIGTAAAILVLNGLAVLAGGLVSEFVPEWLIKNIAALAFLYFAASTNEGMGAALIVWIGCSLGLFAADILGMLVGYLLKSKTPDGLLNTLAFVIFSTFGVYTLYQGLKLISSSVCRIPVLLILIAVVVIFAGLCAFLFVRQKKKKEEKI